MNGNAKWAVWLFRLVISVALAGIVADRVRFGDRMGDAERDIRELQTEVRIYHGGNDG